MSDPAHSSLGASGASRWINCPASVALSAGFEDTESIYAAEGTAAHGIAEYCLNYELATADRFEGRLMRDCVSRGSTKKLLGDKVVTREMVEAVNVYLDHVLEQLNGGDGRKLYVEQKVDLSELMPKLPKTVKPFGTCDVIIVDELARELFVNDFKYGAGTPVAAEDNEQLRYYGVGAMLAYKDRGFQKVTVSIIQPRTPGAAVVSETMHAYDLTEWAMFTLVPGAYETQNPNAKAKAGPWCKYCKAKGKNCETFERESFAAVTDAFGAIVDPADVAVKELGARYAKIPLLKQWIKTVEEMVEAEARAGRMPDGLKWIAGRGLREWAGSDLAVAHEVANSTGVDITDKIVLSVAQAEKRVGKKLFEKVKHLVEMKPGKPKLAPLSDPKPAIEFAEVNATEVFGAIENYE
jgi:hypothetical protein